MIKYLLDTNICIFFFKGKHNLDHKIKKVGIQNCFISEITLAELKFGAENSSNPNKHRKIIEQFQKNIQILPILSCLDKYASEKTRLRKLGTPLDEFDLLIGATAIENNLVLVTNNSKHLDRLNEIKLEDWTKE